MGFAPADLFRDQTPEEEAAMRQLAVNACKDVLHNSSDAAVRADAMKILTHLGAMK